MKFVLPILAVVLNTHLAFAQRTGEQPCEQARLEISRQGEELVTQMTNQCWRSEQRQAMAERGDVNSSQLMQVDRQICTCLRRAPITTPIMRILPQTPTPTVDTRSADMALTEKNNNITTYNNQLANERNGMLLQATLLMSDTDGVNEFISAFNFNELDSTIANRSRSLNQSLSRGHRPGEVNQVNVTLARSYMEDPVPMTSCISPREILGYTRQVPEKNEFYIKTASMTFDPDDWNYSKLMEKVDTYLQRDPMVGVSPAQESDLHDAFLRMKFLNNNILYKNLFMSDSNRPAVTRAKADLFDAIKRSVTFPNDKCNNTNPQLNLCAEAFAGEKRHKDLRREAAKILANSVVIDAARATGREVIDHLMDTAESTINRMIPFQEYFLPEGLSENCSDRTGENLANCLALFAEYCRNMDRMLPSYSGNEFESAINSHVYPQLARPISNGPALSTEADYIEQALCNSPRSNPERTPATMDAMTFKTNNCSAGPEALMCQNTEEGRKTMLIAYLQAYPGEPNSGNQEMSAEVRVFFNYISNTITTEPDAGQPESAVAKTAVADVDVGQVNSAGYGSRYSGSSTKAAAEAMMAGSSTGTAMRNFSSSVAESAARISDEGKRAVRPEASPRSVTSPQGSDPLLNFNPLLSPSAAIPAVAIIPARAILDAATTDQIAALREREEAAERAAQEAETRLADARARARAPQTPATDLTDLRSLISSLTRTVETERAEASSLRDRIRGLETPAAGRSVASVADQGTGRFPGPTVPQDFSPRVAPIAPQIVGSGTSAFPVGNTRSGLDSGNGGGFAGIAGSIGRGSAAARSPGSSHEMMVKYDLARVSANGSLIVATDRSSSGPGSVDAGLVSAAAQNPSVDLGAVSPETYSGFENRDLGILGQFADRIRNIPGDIVRISVAASVPGRPRIEMIVVKNNGRLLFQPIRTLAALNGAIGGATR